MNKNKKYRILESIKNNNKYSKNKKDIHYLISNGYLKIKSYKIYKCEFIQKDGSIKILDIKKPDVLELTEWGENFLLFTLNEEYEEER